MAKTKITALTELTDTNIAIGDLIPIVDISDTSQAASGTTKKVTITSLATAVASAFSNDNATFVNLNTTGTTTLGDSGDATTVNGTLGVTGVITAVGNTTGGIKINDASGNQGATIHFLGSSTTPNWQVGNQVQSSNAFTVTPSTTNGGTTFTTPALTIIGTTSAAQFAGTLGVTGVTTFTDNIVMGNGKGIDFSATANSSGAMASELLNDYEEGTWTPTVGGGLTVSGTFSSSGTYVKIGNIVYVNGFVGGATSVSVATADTVLCSALPFTAAASTNHTALGLNSATTASIPLQITTTTVYAAGTMAATAKIHFSGTYHI